MRPVSELFLATLRISHAVATRVVLTFPDDPTPIELPVTGGDVTLDRTAIVRRTGGLTVPWTPRDVARTGLDLRTLPYGGTADVRRGIRYGDGTLELAELGVYRVDAVSWSDRAGIARLELSDRMAQVRDEPFVEPFVPGEATGVTLTVELVNLATVLTGLESTAGILAGMTVEGGGIVPGTTVVSVDSATQITLSNPVYISRTKSVKGQQNSDELRDISDTSDLLVGMKIRYPWRNQYNQEMSRGTTYIAEVGDDSVKLTKPTADVWFGDSNGSAETGFDEWPIQQLLIGGGDRIATVIRQLVEAVYAATIDYRITLDPGVLASDIYLTQNRAQAVVDLARSIGGDAYFDAAGVFAVEPTPDGSGDPQWTVDAGETGVLVDAAEQVERAGVHNGVVVRGQASAADPPFAVLVVDDDPSSPTRWGGPFGKVARVEDRTTSVQTVQQATDIASSLLAEALGLQRTLTLTSAPNPALEPGDVIDVVLADGRVERHLVDVIRLGLSADSEQALSTRVVSSSGAVPAGSPLGLGRRVFTGAELAAELAGAKVAVPA